MAKLQKTTCYVDFFCEDCGENWGGREVAEMPYEQARNQAQKHHKKTGHFISGQVCFAVNYGTPPK